MLSSPSPVDYVMGCSDPRQSIRSQKVTCCCLAFLILVMMLGDTVTDICSWCRYMSSCGAWSGKKPIQIKITITGVTTPKAMNGYWKIYTTRVLYIIIHFHTQGMTRADTQDRTTMTPRFYLAIIDVSSALARPTGSQSLRYKRCHKYTRNK